MKRIIMLPNSLKVKYETEGAGNINASAIIQTLLETEGITKKKDNVICTISNLLVDGHSIEGAYYNMKEHSIELELNDKPYSYYKKCPRCGKPMNGFTALSRKDNKTEICSECGQDEATEAFNNYYGLQ